MLAPHKKLAESLSVLAGLQGENRRIFRTEEMRRDHRERQLLCSYCSLIAAFLFQ